MLLTFAKFTVRPALSEPIGRSTYGKGPIIGLLCRLKSRAVSIEVSVVDIVYVVYGV